MPMVLMALSPPPNVAMTIDSVRPSAPFSL